MEALQEIRLLFGVGAEGKANATLPNGVNIGIGINGQGNGKPIVIKTRWSSPAELGMIQPAPTAMEVPVERTEDRNASEPSGPHSKWNPNGTTPAASGAPADKARGI